MIITLSLNRALHVLIPSVKYRHSMLRCEAIAAHMLKPAEVAAQFLKQQPQFAEMGGIGHAGSQYGALRFA